MEEGRAVDLSRNTLGFGFTGAILLLVCVGLMLFGDMSWRQHMLQSYLWAWVFWGGLTLGCFGLILLHHMVRGTWGASIMRLLEAGGGGTTLFWMGVLLLPVVIAAFTGTSILYAWADPEIRHTDHILHSKEPYLNPGFNLVRYLIFFAFWVGVAAFLRRSTMRQDRTLDGVEAQKRTNLAAPAFVLFFVTATLFLTDWVMSLDHHWFSTMFGPQMIVGNGLAALCLCTALLCAFADRLPFADVVSPKLTRDLGNLILAINLLWSYMTFSQYMIIWAGNLPEFTQYFVDRARGGWEWIPIALIFLHFMFPFLLLLNPSVKRYPRNLMLVAGWIFLMRIVDSYWALVGGFENRGAPLSGFIFDILAFAALGLLWLALAAGQLRRAPLLPRYDQRLQEALHSQHA